MVDNIGLLVTNDPELGEVRDAALVIEDGVVAAVERAGAQGDGRIDAGGRCVIPGFVDSHTHLVFAGDLAQPALALDVQSVARLDLEVGDARAQRLLAARTRQSDQLVR